MKLISCHIENFGKLQNFDYSFDQEKSIIHEDNGWGKSTLATFIRVMFYGFKGENKRNIIDNERKRYKPWQTGNYGGSIVFSVNEKEYRLERQFGEKKSGTDYFALYDNYLNLKSDDYSTNIGEELFGIDIESFMRTVFIAQQDCGTEVTPNISAKIGNVSDQTADMGNYDDVQNALKKEMDRLTPNRATGYIYKTDMKISELKEKIRNKDNYTTSLNELSKKLKEQVDLKENKQKELKNVQNELECVAAIKDSLSGAEKYQELCEQVERATKHYSKERAFFPNDIPVKADVESAIKKFDEYEDKLQIVNNFSLSDTEKNKLSIYEGVFKTGTPDESLLKQVEDRIDRISEIEAQRASEILSETERKKLNDAKNLFKNYKPELEEIDDLTNKWNERKSKKEVLSTKKANAELIKNSSVVNKNVGSSNKMVGILLLVIGIIVAFGGVIAITVSKNVAIGSVIILLGAVVAIVGFISSAGIKGESTYGQENSGYNQMVAEISRDERFISNVEFACRDLFEKLGVPYSEYDVQIELSRIRGLVKDYDDLAERNKKEKDDKRENDIKELVDYISTFFKRYNMAITSSDYQKALYQLKNYASEYVSIKDKQDKTIKSSRDGEALVNEIKTFLMSLGFNVEDDIKNQLFVINEKCISIELIAKELEEKIKRKEEFEKSNDVDKYKDTLASAKNISIEDLNKLFNELKGQIDSISELEDTFRKQMDDVASQLEIIDNYEYELTNLQEEYEKAKKKYEVIGKTREYLEKAKHNFSSKYMDDIKKSFEKYYQMISDSDDKYELDANLNIQLKEKDSLHEIGYLSEGYKDLVGLCRRMAMVDAMYDLEKPFLIFDDPFVNLDETRTDGAMRFMDSIAKEYQIVYFSCHQSRC